MTFADLDLTEPPSQRRAKIVATLGPASNTEPVIRELIHAGVDVDAAQLFPRQPRAQSRRHPEDPQVEQGRATAAVHPGRPAGAQDSHRAAQGSSAGAAQGRSPVGHHAARGAGHGGVREHHLQDSGRKRGAGLAHSALRRPDRAARARDRRRRRGLRHREWRPAGRAQGHQSSRRAGAHALADGEGRRGSGVRAQARRRRHRRLVCAHGGRREPGAQPRRRPRFPHLDHRQAGKAAGGRASRRHPAGLRRHHGGPRRPGRGSSAGKGSRHSEVHHPPRRRVLASP